MSEETPKTRDEAIEAIAKESVEYSWRVKAFIEAAEKLGLRLVSAAALAPFLTMERACEHLHGHEPIAMRTVNGGNNTVVVLDVNTFHALAEGVLEDKRAGAAS